MRHELNWTGLAAGLAAVVLLFAAAPARTQDSLSFTYPRMSLIDDTRSAYPLDLLRLLLDKSGVGAYTVQRDERMMEQSRAVAEVERGGSINIVWVGSSPALEERLRPVRVPMYRGLLGWRIFIIQQDRQAEFSQVRTLDDLRRKTAGQGVGWSDVAILRAAGLKVHEDAYDQIFAMVAAGRIDYFPRGAHEPFVEVAQRAKFYPELAVEHDLVLIYPFEMYFFVARGDDRRGRVLDDGYRNAVADGSWDRFFNGHSAIRTLKAEARLDERRQLFIAPAAH
jgi:hypothetical protein